MYRKRLFNSVAKTEKISERLEQSREFQRKVIIGDILWMLHRQQGTEALLIQAIAPYLQKEQRVLFALV